MLYIIEVNVARKGSPPIWRQLLNDNNAPCVWINETDARHALDSEGRGDNARVIALPTGSDATSGQRETVGREPAPELSAIASLADHRRRRHLEVVQGLLAETGVFPVC